MSIIGNPKYLHIGTKAVLALDLTRGEYNEYRGWKTPINENPHDKGYFVEYMDGGKPNHPDHVGYVSWSPKDVFENSYKPSGQLSFGEALFALKLGKKIARSGWNGKGMHIEYRDNPTWNVNPHFVIKNVAGTFDTWVPSISDILAEDWVVSL